MRAQLEKRTSLPGSISKSSVERISRVRLDHFLHELHVDRVFPKNFVLVHRFKIDRDEKWPRQFRIDPLAAFDAQHLRDFQQLHPGVHHHLFDSRGSDFGLQLKENDVVNHGGLGLGGERVSRKRNRADNSLQIVLISAACETPTFSSRVRLFSARKRNRPSGL